MNLSGRYEMFLGGEGNAVVIGDESFVNGTWCGPTWESTIRLSRDRILKMLHADKGNDGRLVSAMLTGATEEECHWWLFSQGPERFAEFAMQCYKSADEKDQNN